jgi:hypothetical protein
VRHRKIERAMKKRFPGWRGKIWEDESGVHLEANGKKTYYHLYPGMSKDDADRQIVKDVIDVIRRYIPGFELTGYEQHGQYITPTAGD